MVTATTYEEMQILSDDIENIKLYKTLDQHISLSKNMDNLKRLSVNNCMHLQQGMIKNNYNNLKSIKFSDNGSLQLIAFTGNLDNLKNLMLIDNGDINKGEENQIELILPLDLFNLDFLLIKRCNFYTLNLNSNFHKLKKLSIKDNYNLTHLNFNIEIPELTELVIEGNKIKSLIFNVKMNNLVTCIIRDNKTEMIRFNYPMFNVETLNLSGNKLTEINLNKLLVKIVNLNLSNNYLKYYYNPTPYLFLKCIDLRNNDSKLVIETKIKSNIIKKILIDNTATFI